MLAPCLYADYVFGDEFGTHYVALAYRLHINNDQLELPINCQHNEYNWFSQEDLLRRSEVHRHTKWYFQNND